MTSAINSLKYIMKMRNMMDTTAFFVSLCFENLASTSVTERSY